MNWWLKSRQEKSNLFLKKFKIQAQSGLFLFVAPVLNVPLIADWQLLTKRREHVVNENLRRNNLKRRRFDYSVNQKVLKKAHAPKKLGKQYTGPYVVQQVHVNGTVTIQLNTNVTERINIRRIIPYKEPIVPD